MNVRLGHRCYFTKKARLSPAEDAWIPMTYPITNILGKHYLRSSQQLAAFTADAFRLAEAVEDASMQI